MKMQHEAPRPPMVTLAVIGIIALAVPILIAVFLVGNYAGQYVPPAPPTTSTTTQIGVANIVIPPGSANPSNPPGYAPDKATIVLGVNSTVVWTNKDTAAHTVTSTSVPTGAAQFDSGNLPAGGSFNYTFTTPGTYQYDCSYHSWMTGTLVVVGKGAAASALTPVSVTIPVGASNPSNPPGYSPDKITVVIGVNNTVTWTNDDTAAHTVTSTSVPTGAASFDSGNLPAKGTFSYTFTTPGTYQYDCSYHSWMTGTVVVVGKSAPAPTVTGVAVSIPVGANNPSNPPGYSPDKITVVIGVNNTVTWTNDDTAAHTVTSTSVPAGASSFDSGNMPAKATFSYTFTAPGTYQYDCSYHSWMTGTVTVKSA